MILAEVAALLEPLKNPEVLREGTRELPDNRFAVLRDVAKNLAERLPKATFWSGNATGSDSAFAEGLNAVDPTRLELLVPQSSMGRSRRHLQKHVHSVTPILPEFAQDLLDCTVRATPSYERLVASLRARDEKPNSSPKARKARATDTYPMRREP